MKSPEEVRRAKVLIVAACDFLRERSEDTATMLTFDFHAGAAHALKWMLEMPDGQMFGDYLVMLDKLEQGLIEGVSARR